MKKITVCDRTLGAGAKLLNYKIKKAFCDIIINSLEKANVDVIEIGVLKNETYDEGRRVFNDISLISNIGTTSSKKAVSMRIDEDIDFGNQKNKCIDIVSIEIDLSKVGILVDCVEKVAKIECINKLGYMTELHFVLNNEFNIDDIVLLSKRINFNGIVLEDQMGVYGTIKLFQLFSELDRRIDKNIYIGYFGQNSLNQCSSIVYELLKAGFNRNLMINTCLNGVFGGAGTSKTELICTHINAISNSHYDIDELQKVVNNYIYNIFWEFNYTYDSQTIILSENKLNPEIKYELKNRKVSDVLELSTKGILYSNSKKERKRGILDFCHKKSELAVIVLTANRFWTMCWWLKSAVLHCSQNNVDLIVYDSSSDDSTRRVTERTIEDGYTNVIYKRYGGVYDGFSLDHKVLEAYKEFGKDYKYLWLIRDGLVPTTDYCFERLKEQMDAGVRCIIVDAAFRNNNQKFTKTYLGKEDAESLLSEQIARLQTLGTLIVSSDYASELIKNVPLNEDTYSLWQMAAPFHMFSQKPEKIVFLTDEVFIYNLKGSKTHFWSKGTNYLKQWCTRWIAVIDGMPCEYDNVKSKNYQVYTCDFHPFTAQQIIKLRAENVTNLRVISDFKKDLVRVTKTSIFFIYLVQLISPKMIQFAKNNSQKRLFRIIRKLVLSIS